MFEKALPDKALIDEDKDFSRFMKVVAVCIVTGLGCFMIGMAVANMSHLATC